MKFWQAPLTHLQKSIFITHGMKGFTVIRKVIIVLHSAKKIHLFEFLTSETTVWETVQNDVLQVRDI